MVGCLVELLAVWKGAWWAEKTVASRAARKAVLMAGSKVEQTAVC